MNAPARKPRTQKPNSEVSNSTGSLTAVIRPRLSYNPLEKLFAGEMPPRVNVEHKKSGRTGNLFFEYIQNVPQFRGLGVDGKHVAEFCSKRGLMIYDEDMDRYEWVEEPMKKRDFLRIFSAALQIAE